MELIAEETRLRADGFVVGLVLALIGTAVCFVLVLASDLTNDGVFYGLIVGSGLLFVAGVALGFVRSSRPVGFGLMVGAPVAFAIEYAILLALILSVTS